MYESRCGVCCGSCERKEQVHCTGCTNMRQPFWGGSCGVKSCCEERGWDHCGRCPEFPCPMLAGMGVELGFDPEPRLELLRKWAQDSDRAK